MRNLTANYHEKELLRYLEENLVNKQFTVIVAIVAVSVCVFFQAITCIFHACLKRESNVPNVTVTHRRMDLGNSFLTEVNSL